jgi:hypothetical protein
MLTYPDQMDHYLIKTKFPGAPRMVLALIRQDKTAGNRFYYDLYQVGHFLGSVFPAISAQGGIVWDTIHQMDNEFVKLIGKQILKQGWKKDRLGM